jgi:hypothetical protein
MILQSFFRVATRFLRSLFSGFEARRIGHDIKERQELQVLLLAPDFRKYTTHTHNILGLCVFLSVLQSCFFLLRGREVLCDYDWTVFGSDSSWHIIPAHQWATALTDRTSPKSGPLQEACRIFHHQTGSTSTWRLSSVRNPSPHSISCADICNRSSIDNCPTRKLSPAADTVLSGSGEVGLVPAAHHQQA